jgi:6-phosphofructokinase 2
VRAQIITLTLNPAVDMAATAAAVRPTHKIRTFDERLDPGGGGINVARVVHALGGDALALIMTGDVTGHLVEELLDEAAVRWHALHIRGRTRISLNVHDRQSGLEYRFVPEGPNVEADEWHGILNVLRDVEAEWIVASGSLPRGVPADFYAQAAAIAAERGQRFVLDTSGAALRAAVGHGLELLKVSLGELEFLISRELADPRSQEEAVTSLIRSGAVRMIAVSLGRDGAILGTGDGIHRLPAVSVQERSAVGAGDSFLAGLVLGLARGMSHRDALAFGVAAGAAAVVTYGTAQVRPGDLEVFYREARGEPETADHPPSPLVAPHRSENVPEDIIKTAHQVADRLRQRGHARLAAHLRGVLLERRAAAVLLTAVREACQTVVAAVEAIDPVSATMVEELRLEVDMRIKELRGREVKYN